MTVRQTTVHQVRSTTTDFVYSPHTVSEVLLELVSDMVKELTEPNGLPVSNIADAQLRISFRSLYDPWEILAIGTVEVEK